MPLEIGAYRRILNPLVSNPRWRPRRHRRLRSASPRSASRCPCSRTTFDPAALRERAAALEAQMGEAGFWDDPEAAAKVNAEYARVQRRLDTYEALEADTRDLDGLVELAEEDEDLAAELDETLASGVHRLVRLSPFDSANRRQTSFAGVEVAPVVEEAGEIEIDDDDLQIDTYRASGAGGQHVNKTDSAVRITHKPSGIVVQCQNERSQSSNRATAMAMLRSKLVEAEERRRKEEIARERGEAQDVNFGSQIRSYVLHPYTMVKDHRTDHEVGSADRVLDGDLDGFVRAWLEANARATR